MASSYTANIGIEKPGTGEQAGTWGTTTNNNFDIIDRAINGVVSLSLSGTTTTLTTTDGSLSDGGHKVLVLGGSPSGTNTITISPNDQDKLYLVSNGTNQTATFTQGSGGNVNIIAGESAWIFADGAGSGAAITKASFIPASDAVTTAAIADSAVTTAKIADGTIATADMADDAVTAAKLASDAVVNASVASGAAIAFSKMADLTASRALVSDGSGDVSVSAVTSTELGYLDGVTSAIQTQIDGIAGYPQVFTVLTSGSSYAIPSSAKAILIRASGGGGSGGSSQFSGNSTVNGNVGSDTTVTNSNLSISITAKGGASGRGSTGGTATAQTGDSGGDSTLLAGGAAGGAPGMNNFDISCSFGGNGNLVTKYVIGDSVGGETLSISIGAGGAAATAGSTTSAAGQTGYVEITVW
jgi:hypothetical protein